MLPLTSVKTDVRYDYDKYSSQKWKMLTLELSAIKERKLADNLLHSITAGESNQRLYQISGSLTNNSNLSNSLDYMSNSHTTQWLQTDVKLMKTMKVHQQIKTIQHRQIKCLFSIRKVQIIQTWFTLHARARIASASVIGTFTIMSLINTYHTWSTPVKILTNIEITIKTKLIEWRWPHAWCTTVKRSQKMPKMGKNCALLMLEFCRVDLNCKEHQILQSSLKNYTHFRSHGNVSHETDWWTSEIGIMHILHNELCRKRQI